ncbi:glycosyl transferase (plasmid) [Nitratiruptor sp. YY08-26]|uniref:glycosyltransferase family 2 protein n=1 Tax=unclassified Nitratiruptor TaxID=2624044 RepID=UPI0018ED8E1E|nr:MULTISPECIES: glycosyltransferase family 2 protein [unclassified Nitratiruptor]BCD63177.1 glycosyl transferase [Nitratiruptor sp. YY08-13]BCD67113.1 glycosyl transferase [Nitratiruptor sp. YY08-26]
MSPKPFTLAMVVPCYNEEEVLPTTINELEKLLDRLKSKGLVDEKSFICFVDDGSRDRTWELIQEEAVKPHIKGLKLSRNYGHQNALLAGLFYAEGLCDAAVSMDADLQDDISVVEQMCQKYQKGYEIVYGVRKRRDTDTLFKRITAEGFYKVMRFMGVDIIENHADFRLMSKRALFWLKEFEEVNLFLRGIIPLLGLKSDKVYYDRKERLAGESKYPLKKMLAFAWDGITSFSVAPLRLITFLGIAVLVVSLLLSIWAILAKISGQAVSGWTSMMLIVLFLGGVQMLSIGIIGEYIGKIYKETKRRPRFFVEKIEG